MVILVRYYGDTWANLTRLHASKPVEEACESPVKRQSRAQSREWMAESRGTGDGARNRLSLVPTLGAFTLGLRHYVFQAVCLCRRLFWGRPGHTEPGSPIVRWASPMVRPGETLGRRQIFCKKFYRN
jgi:hypothetical protein